MKYYYLEGRERRGPFDDAAWHDTVRRGAVARTTLVWHTDATGWTPYRDLPADRQPLPAAELPAPRPPDYELPCSDCGAATPASRLFVCDAGATCSRCRPRMAQRLVEGATAPGALPLADMAGRFAAKMLDGLAIMALTLGTVIPLGAMVYYADPDMLPWMILPFYVLMFLYSALYTILFVSLCQATPGKMALGLRIVMQDGTRLRTGRATGRFFSELLTGYSMYIGYVMALVDREHRALHDLICSTRVVRVD